MMIVATMMMSSPQDVAFGEVKLSQLGDYLARRDKSPVAVARAASRYGQMFVLATTMNLAT